MSFSDTYKSIRVLDLSTNLAGPLAAMILGDLGADVIKIERPPAGDDTRSLPPHWKGEATVFMAVNRNKRSVLLDIRGGAGRDALMRLVARADVLVESFPPGFAEKHRLRVEDLRSANAALIVCSISAFGDGPLGSKLPGYDALVQAVSGMMSFTGHPNDEAVRLAPSVLDLTTGQWAAIGIMAALQRRANGEKPDHVRPALLDSAASLMCHQVLAYKATGKPPEKLGSGAPSAAPYRVFKASDGDFMLATATDQQFARLCEALGMAELAQDVRFRTMEARIKARAALDEILARRFAKEPLDTWLTRLSEAGISAGRVNSLAHALDSEVMRERNLFVSPEQAGWVGGFPQLRLPIDADAAAVRRPPPKLGEHTAEVLREAGLDEASIAKVQA